MPNEDDRKKGESRNASGSLTDQSPIRVENQIDAHVHRNDAETTNQALVDRIDRSDRWMIGLTAVIAVGGLISAIIFGGQLNVMQGQLDEMKTASRIAENTLLTSQRAYVFINDIDLIYGDDATSKFWQAIPRWENAGNTATFEMTSHINYYNLPSDLPTRFSRCDFDSEHVRLILSGKDKSNVSFMRIVPTAVSAFKSGDSKSRHMKFWGWAKYKDAIDYQNHITRFCWNIESIGGDPGDPNANLRMTHSLCSEGNCTDKECEAEDAANYSIPKTPNGCTLALIPIQPNATPAPSPPTPSDIVPLPRPRKK
jgi:hypothetical protein